MGQVFEQETKGRGQLWAIRGPPYQRVLGTPFSVEGLQEADHLQPVLDGGVPGQLEPDPVDHVVHLREKVLCQPCAPGADHDRLRWTPADLPELLSGAFLA